MLRKNRGERYICNNLPVQDRTGKYCGASEMSVKKNIRRESKDGSKGKSVHTGQHSTRKPERILITDNLYFCALKKF
jgi:hypothetical protein